MKIIAGIDGGGTRTRLALVQEDGVLLSFAQGNSCSFVEQGIENAKNELSRIWQTAWLQIKEPARPVDALFMGMGSILSTNDALTNCELVQSLELVRPGQAQAENDAFCALSGGLCGGPGILLISGTGSACFGRNASGQTWRAGGWGYRLDDVGSAHALGLAAMVAATRDADARAQPTRLTAMVQEKLGINEMTEIYRRVHHQNLARADIAALAPQVVTIAQSGDLAAHQILQDQADGLVKMVATVAHQLQLPQPYLALTGGLITGAILFREMFLNKLEKALPGFSLVHDGFPPVLGAAMLAVQIATGHPPTDAFIQNLRRTSTTIMELKS